MSQNVRNHTNTLFLLKVVFLLCCTCLSACMPDPNFIFLGFPIRGMTGEYGEYFPLSTTARIIFSIVWYAFLLIILATVPLYIAKCFKSASFYKAYKMFWWYGAFVFTTLTAVLIGIIPKEFEGILVFIMWYSITLFITLVPANFQHKRNNSPPN